MPEPPPWDERYRYRLSRFFIFYSLDCESSNQTSYLPVMVSRQFVSGSFLFRFMLYDDCFSGGERNGGVLMAADGKRGFKLKPEPTDPIGNTVVFSATQGDQTASPYAEKGHGIFTYYLLKKLKDTGGSVSLAELADYITHNVQQTAFELNRQDQTPTVVTSRSNDSEWRNLRLNN